MIDAHLDQSLRRQAWSPRFHAQCSSVGGGAGKKDRTSQTEADAQVGYI